MVHSVKNLLGMDWLANECVKGAGGAQEKLLKESRGEDTVYMRLHHKNGYRYGAAEAQKVAELAGRGNHHLYELIPGDRKRKFYLEYDKHVPDDGRPPEEHQRAFEELQAKAVADAERLCGPGRAVLSGSWGKKEDYIRYSLHLVRPDRYFPDLAATIHMPALAKSVGADHSTYTNNQLLKLPGQSKRKDPRVQAVITGELQEHIVTAFFDENARSMNLEALTEAASGSAPPPRPPLDPQRATPRGRPKPLD